MHIRTGFICLLTVLSVTCGCLPPPDYIDFKAGSKTKDHLKLKLAGGNVRLRLYGVGGIAPESGRYGLSLGISCKYPKIPGQLKFDPQEIDVLLNGRSMKKPRHFIDHKSLEETEDSYYISVAFEEPGGEGVPLFAKSVEPQIKIALGDFITLNGKPLAIDTVHAIDPLLQPSR